ncbi:MAG: hypothetical protein ACN6O2_01465 [Stenotrophomonas sp.]
MTEETDQQRARDFLLAQFNEEAREAFLRGGFDAPVCVTVQSALRAITAALRAAPEWQPIETAPEGRLVVVGWLDTEDSHYPENYEFDYLEGGLWSKHEDYVEHAHAVAPPGSQMPKEEPPYQWWMDLPAFPTARPQGVKDRQPIDGCTESNCKRCRTHPNHRGDMEHAGIGWRPDSPQEASDA